MMRKKLLAAAVAASLTLTSGTTLAAKNPFKDLPEGHWAYDAVTMLAEDGVLEGYGDDTFRGDRLMNRYEMAEIVSKALEKYDIARPADKGAIKKLQNEFAEELKDMDVRLKAVENDVAEMKKGMSSFKWWGDARVRYFKNKNLGMVSGSSSDVHNSQWKTSNSNEMRLRLGFYGEPAKQLSVTGQLKFETDKIASSSTNGVGGGTSHASGYTAGNISYQKVGVQRLQLDWHAKNDFTVSAGRNEVSLGQGLIYWENPIDAIMVRKNFGDTASLLVGYGDASPGTWAQTSDYAFFANASYQLSPAVKLTAAYYASHSDDNNGVNNVVETWDNGNTWYSNYNSILVSRKFKQFAYGFNAQLAPRWNLVAEGIHNGADVTKSTTATGTTDTALDNNDRNGWWTRLTYGNLKWNEGGTWNVYGEYLSLGGLAVDSSGWAHHLNIAGGNGYGGAGAKGFGLASNYMLAANTNLEVAWYKLKPYREQPGYSKYKDTGYAALTYSF